MRELDRDLSQADSVLRELGSEYGDGSAGDQPRHAPPRHHAAAAASHATAAAAAAATPGKAARAAGQQDDPLAGLERDLAVLRGVPAKAHAAATPPPPPLPRKAAGPPPLVLVVMVAGLRHDYMSRYYCSNLQRLARHGVRAGVLRPVFPASEWPNLWSMATGLGVAEHGIFDSYMFDADAHRVFDAERPSTLEDPRWWRGEPFWTAAQRRNLTAAMVSWPGAEVRVRGTAPAYVKPWRASTAADDETHARAALSLLDMPAANRPRLLGVHLGGVDAASRRHGPASWRTIRAVEEADRLVGELLEGVAQRGLAGVTDVVVVSDHGYATMHRTARAVYLDDYVDLGALDVVRWSPLLQVRPKVDRVETLINVTTTRVPHLTLWRREGVPASLDLPADRLAPIVGLPDTGYFVTSRARGAPGGGRGDGPLFGGDGFLRGDTHMGATLLAQGPSVAARGLRVPTVDVTSVHALVCRLVGVARADGSAAMPEALERALKA